MHSSADVAPAVSLVLILHGNGVVLHSRIGDGLLHVAVEDINRTDCEVELLALIGYILKTAILVSCVVGFDSLVGEVDLRRVFVYYLDALDLALTNHLLDRVPVARHGHCTTLAKERIEDDGGNDAGPYPHKVEAKRVDFDILVILLFCHIVL